MDRRDLLGVVAGLAAGSVQQAGGRSAPPVVLFDYDDPANVDPAEYYQSDVVIYRTRVLICAEVPEHLVRAVRLRPDRSVVVSHHRVEGPSDRAVEVKRRFDELVQHLEDGPSGHVKMVDSLHVADVIRTRLSSVANEVQLAMKDGEIEVFETVVAAGRWAIETWDRSGKLLKIETASDF